MGLSPTFKFGALDLSYPFSVEFGSDRGSPEQIVADVQSSLSDGSLTRVTKYDNRTVTLPVMIEGPTMAALADSEALLVAEALKERNEFTFNPGDGTSVDSVFETFTADLVPVYDDNAEIALLRRYTLTFKAHPWPHSATKVITPAVTTAAPTVVDSGSSTTNWSIIEPTGAALSVVSGAVRSTYNPGTIHPNGQYGSALQRTATISTATDKYISIDWKSSIPVYYGLQTSANLWPGTEVRREPGAVAGFTRSWFQIPDSVTSLAWIRFATTHPANTGSATLEVDLVQKASALPASGTTRQLTRSIYPGGSVPAEGDVLVQHPTLALGQTIVFSHPIDSGYTPALRQWRTSGGPTAAVATNVSGYTDDISAGTATVYSVPIRAVPEGGAQLWIKVGGSAVGNAIINWSARSWQGFYPQVEGIQSGSTTINIPIAGGRQFLFPIANVTLPPSKVADSGTGYVVFTVQRDAASSGNAISLDEMWCFATDRGRLTVVDCGLGTVAAGSVANRLRISSPSLDSPNGELALATRSDWGDSWEPAGSAILCDQTGHRFDPEGAMIFTVTTGPTDADVSLEHFPRWHTNAAY